MARQAQQWRKRILVPFWILRIAIMLFIIGSYAYTLRTLKNIKDVQQPAVATVVLFLLMIIIVLLLDIMAIVLFLRDALKPVSFLTMNVFQTSFWAGVLVLNVVALLREQGSLATLGFSAVIFLTFVGLLIYSWVGYRRAKNAALRGNYAPTHNPALHSAPSNPPQYQPHDAYQSQTSLPLQSPHPPPYQAGTAGDYYSQQPMKPAYMI